MDLWEVSMEINLRSNEEEVEKLPLRGNKNKTIIVSKKLPQQFKDKLSELFKEFEKVFAWDHTKLKGIDPNVCQHKIPLRMDVRPIKMQRY